VRPDGPAEPGKIRKALWITSQFSEEIEADFQRYYGLDFLEFYRPGRNLGWRKLLVLVDKLPPESAVNTAIRMQVSEDEMVRAKPDPARAPWSTVEMLLALLIDEMRNLSWMYATAKTGKALPRPEPVQRPGLRRRSGRVISLDAARRLDPRLRNVPDEEAQETLDRITGRG